MESVTITSVGAVTGATDAQGNPVRGASSSVTSTGWYVAGNNGGSEDPTGYGTADVPRITIYNKTVVAVKATDQITIRGNVWKVVGVVEGWVSPLGSIVGGTAVTLERAG